MYKALGPSWNKLTIDRLREILTSVLLDFEVGCGAISFFTTKNECIKAERGYNLNRISRPMSIAAHALLSADVFVIPDAEKVLVEPLLCTSHKLTSNRTGVFKAILL